MKYITVGSYHVRVQCGFCGKNINIRKQDFLEVTNATNICNECWNRNDLSEKTDKMPMRECYQLRK